MWKCGGLLLAHLYKWKGEDFGQPYGKRIEMPRENKKDQKKPFLAWTSTHFQDFR